ncbi:MAG: ROK family transcriptional regulator [Acidobacteria bacterium]|nr:ROK family transcriptional regulator [Acidobacteriota bacterium]MBV9437886.1 ROK family transcriptional regulator [Acidobacteriota bacterium]
MRRLDFTNTQVASSETARDINRSVLLNLIRRKQPISRADLARVSGLQRSTVSLITEQLIDESWVINGPTGRLPRGRRPTFLRLNENRAILVADIRPAQITVALADVNGQFLEQVAFPTPSDAAAGAQKISSRLRDLMRSHSKLVFEGVGISLPGRFEPVSKRIIFAPNLKWRDFDLKRSLERSTGLRVEMENAANACVLAEVWFGHAEKIRDMVVVTVSEGIGSGIFLNGQLMRGAHGMAGEFGHVSLDPAGPPCTCGRRGCWEVYASNRAGLRYYAEKNGDSNAISFQELMSRANSSDSAAIHALEKMARALGRGMRMLVAGLAPEEIVVVGEVTSQWSRLEPLITAELGEGVLFGKPPRIRPAEGIMARLRGSVALVLQGEFGVAVPEAAKAAVAVNGR